MGWISISRSGSPVTASWLPADSGQAASSSVICGSAVAGVAGRMRAFAAVAFGGRSASAIIATTVASASASSDPKSSRGTLSASTIAPTCVPSLINGTLISAATRKSGGKKTLSGAAGPRPITGTTVVSSRAMRQDGTSDGIPASTAASPCAQIILPVCASTR